jgi:hypothetical protein
MDIFFQYLMDNGVPRETIDILLMFPIMAGFIVAARQIVGIKAFGIYTPLIITFALTQIGFKYGVSIFIVSLVIASIVRYLLRKIRILYLPKMALILSITALSMFLSLIWGIFSDSTVFVQASIYQILIIITLVEKFINAQMEKGYRTAVILSVETLILAAIGNLIIATTSLRDLVFYNPWIILIVFAGIIFLGRYEGLRISEYIRFRKIISNQ